MGSARAPARRRGVRLGPRRRARRRALVRPLRARPGRARSAGSSTCCRGPPARRRRARRRAGVHGLRGRRHRGGATRISQHARAAEAVLPAERRRRYLETLAIARLYCARLDGDFETALEAADELLAEAAEHGTWSDDAREALVRASLGRAALWAHRLDRARDGARARGLPGARRRAGLRRRLGPERARAARRHAARPGRRRRARARRSSWPSGAAGRTILETAMRARRARHRRVLRPAPAGGREHLGARARRARATARTRHVEFMLDHLEARMAGAVGQPEDGLRALDGFEVTHRRGTPSPYEPASLASMRARLLAAEGDLETANALLAPAARRGLARRRGHGRAPAARRRRPGGARSRRSSRRGRHADGVHNVARLEHVVLEAIARDTAGEPGRAGEAIERALERAEASGHRWTFIEGGRRVEALLRARIRNGTAHRAIVGELLAAFEERDARAPDGRPAAGAAQRARARDPALPADDALQPRDRGGAVRDHQHGQDAPAQHLPQARRRPPARGGRARPRPAPAVNRGPPLRGASRTPPGRAAAAASR